MLGQLGMMPALHENLRAAQREGLLNLLINLLVRNHVGIVRLFAAPKRAKLAVYVTNIRIVDITINAEGDDLIAAPIEGVSLGQFAPAMRQSTKCFQRERIKPQGLIGRNPRTVPRFLDEFIYGWIVDHVEGMYGEFVRTANLHENWLENWLGALGFQ